MAYKTSHSKMKVARRCLRAYYYKYILKLQKRTKSRPLLVGSLVHECIEAYFKNGSYLPVIKEWKIKEFDKMFKEEQALHGDIPQLVKTLMRGYVNRWHKNNLETMWVEKEAQVEIAPGILLHVKIDARFKDNRGMEWLGEHKTCKKMPDESVRQFDVQSVLYNAVLPAMGEKPVNGVCWDYIRTKLPTKPELLKSGELSKAKKIDTLPEVYLREIKKNNLNPGDYSEILEHLESQVDGFYRMIFLPFSDHFSQRILQDFVIDAQRLIELETEYEVWEDDAIFTCNPTRDCGWCDYQTLCYSELRGDDTDYIMKHDYKTRKKYEKDIEIIKLD